MGEINRNEHIIKNMILVIEKMNDEQKIRSFINQIEPSTYSQTGMYKRCIEDLKRISVSGLKGQRYVYEIKQTCQLYLDYATGELYNKTKYDNDYRKRHYKQLNVDVPIETMKEFEKKLKEEKKIKKEIILKWIEDYIEKK